MEPKGAEALTELVECTKKILSGMGTWEWLVLIGILFTLMLFLGSRASGWHRLARHYPNQDGLHAEWISMPDFFGHEGRGGMVVDFNNGQTDAIQLGVDGQGMYFGMSIPFRLFHPPIFVPWSDVKSVAQGIPLFEKKHEIRFTFALCPNVPLDVDLEVAREIEKRAEGRWRMPKEVE